jgi:hypothetical protein
MLESWLDTQPHPHSQQVCYIRDEWIHPSRSSQSNHRNHQSMYIRSEPTKRSIHPNRWGFTASRIPAANLVEAFRVIAPWSGMVSQTGFHCVRYVGEARVSKVGAGVGTESTLSCNFPD